MPRCQPIPKSASAPPQCIALIAALLVQACRGDPTAASSGPWDRTPPTITLSIFDTASAGDSIVISGVASDDSLITRVMVKRFANGEPRDLPNAGELGISPGNPVPFSTKIGIPGDADWIMMFVAFDGRGNVDTAVAKVQSDRTPPILYPILPVYLVEDEPTIVLYAEDHRSRFLDVKYRVDSGALRPAGLYTGGPLQWEVGSISVGIPSRYQIAIPVRIGVGHHVLAITATDRAGNAKTLSTPLAPSPPVSAVVHGVFHWCLLTTDGSAQCWGANDQGQLGNGTLDTASFPQPVSGGLSFTQLAAGWEHTCGLTADGTVYCWGSQEWDWQPGFPRPEPRIQSLVPVLVETDVRFAQVTAAGKQNCGLTANGRAYCWGLNSSGQLGDGTFTTRLSPTPVAGDLAFVTIATENDTSCGITAQSETYCWGNNYERQVGVPGFTEWYSTVPRLVAGGHAFAGVAAGGVRNCGWTAAGAVLCWGHGFIGPVTWEQPTAVASEHAFSQFSLGAGHYCGLDVARKAYCWGSQGEKHLDKTPSKLGSIMVNPLVGFESDPIRSAEGLTFARIAAGANGTCGITPAGGLYCWGELSFAIPIIGRSSPPGSSHR